MKRNVIDNAYLLPNVFQQQYTFIAKSLYKSVDWCDYKTELKQNLKIYIYWQSIFIAKSISTQISIHHWKYNWPLIWKK